jgi:hypothetical protein
VIDATQEDLITLAAAAAGLPRRRRGCPVHPSALYRWTTSGCRGVILESIQIGNVRCTSKQALQRFFEALSAVSGAGAGNPRGPGGRTIAQRQRAAQRAERALIEKGA